MYNFFQILLPILFYSGVFYCVYKFLNLWYDYPKPNFIIKDNSIWDYEYDNQDPFLTSTLNPRFKQTPFYEIAKQFKPWDSVNLGKYGLTKYNIRMSSMNDKYIVFAVHPSKHYVEKRETISDDNLDDYTSYNLKTIDVKSKKVLIPLEAYGVSKEIPTTTTIKPDTWYPSYQGIIPCLGEEPVYKFYEGHIHTELDTDRIATLIRDTIPEVEKLIPEKYKNYYFCENKY